MSGLVFHERVGLEGRCISPFSWRMRYALAHKGLDPEVRLTRFADVERIRALSGQELVPILEDGERVIHDSWAIARFFMFDGIVFRARQRIDLNQSQTG